MPEGPSIVILKEALQPFKNKKVLDAYGNAAIDFNRLVGQKIICLGSWGKHCLIGFSNFFIRIHLMMFGTYRINAHKEGEPRLHLQFKDGELNFYTSQVKLVEGHINDVYNWETDIMSDDWEPLAVQKRLKALGPAKVCDALLNQEIFTGVGNIIKNEALFTAAIHPESQLEMLPGKKLKELLKATRIYSLNFYTWKKENVLSKHWQAYQQKICPRCNIPFKVDNLGKTKRLSFFCTNCQILY